MAGNDTGIVGVSVPLRDTFWLGKIKEVVL